MDTVTVIAQKTLGLETLQTRNSDALDFHQLAVWQIRNALETAYRAGLQAASPEATRPARCGTAGCGGPLFCQPCAELAKRHSRHTDEIRRLQTPELCRPQGRHE